MKTSYFFLTILIAMFALSCKSAVQIQYVSFEKNRGRLIEQLTDMVNNDQEPRAFLSELRKTDINKELYKKKSDSVWKNIEKIDRQNVKKLIKITKKYGFPNPDRLKAPVGAWVIFQHTPNKYKEKVRVLLEKEYKEGRLYNNEYQMILWHLNGRKGLPFNLNGVEIRDLRPNKTH